MFYSDNGSNFDTTILSHLRLIGSKAQCLKWYKGIITGYYVSNTNLLAILELDQPYKTEDKQTWITNLVVHASNLEDCEDE